MDKHALALGCYLFRNGTDKMLILLKKIQGNQLFSISLREYLDDLKHLSKKPCKKNVSIM